MKKLINKKSFTLIELIIVIIILGILSVITFNILSRVYTNYIYTKETQKLNAKVDATLEMISALLKNRVRNTVIVTKYPLKPTDSLETQVDFKSIAELEDNDTDYKILEWIGKDYEAKNGMWSERLKHIQTGWSGFIDLDRQQNGEHNTSEDPKEYNVTSPDTNLTIVKMIDQNITAAYGFNEDPFESNTTALIFAGIDLGGDRVDNDLNISYGWYKNGTTREAKAVFAIQNYKEYLNGNSPQVDMNITTISENNETRLFSRYYLTRSAYALVPIENNETLADGTKINDYNLTFYYNYQPWQGDWWNGTHGESNSTLLATHVTEMRFKKDLYTPMIRVYICIQSAEVELNSTNNLTLCKEKAIF